MVINSPCYQCPKRKDLCHSTCKDYTDYKRKNEAEKLRVAREKRVDGFLKCRGHF